MSERETLRGNIVEDMQRLDDPHAPRDSFAIAQHYALRGYDLPIEEIQEMVRQVASELGYAVA